jgi:hypothetical protein
MHTQFWLGNLNGIDRLEEIGLDGWVILKWILKKCGGRVWTRYTLLRIGSIGGLL